MKSQRDVIKQASKRVRFVDQTQTDICHRPDVFLGKFLSNESSPTTTGSDGITAISVSSNGSSSSSRSNLTPEPGWSASPRIGYKEPGNGASAVVEAVNVPTSRAIVPYVAPRVVCAPEPDEETFFQKGGCVGIPGLAPQVPRAFDLPRSTLIRESAVFCAGSSFTGAKSEETDTMHVGVTVEQKGRRSKWMIVSAKHVEQTAENLREQIEKNKDLEYAVRRHNRERVKIYDAAMKQAEKRKVEGTNEMKHKFKREQDEMRQEVDLELCKISELYQERCRDYATMVSDECDTEISKAAADLRRDWECQKKTINQLVRSAGEEDLQLSVVARALMEQLQEETKDEIAAREAAAYADMKMEFESREVALRAALEREYQAELEGQLLLSEIRHQKEMEQLRTELGGGKSAPVETPTSAIILHNADTPLCKGVEENMFGTPSSTTLPSLSRHPLQQKEGVGVATGKCSSVSGGMERVASPSGRQPGFNRKFPVFKTPLQKVPPHNRDKAERQSSPKPTSVTRIVTNDATRKSKPTANGDLKATPVKQPEYVLDGSITSALMVSPTKGIPGVITPSIHTEMAFSSEGSLSRPKKKKKRLFSTVFS